jgi:hypothetical protein
MRSEIENPDAPGTWRIRIFLLVEPLQKLTLSFDSHVFPWNHICETLWIEFSRIQENAKIVEFDANGNPEEKPMPKCGKGGQWHGFRDFGRAFATVNRKNVDLFDLQTMMQHKSLETTKVYVRMDEEMEKVIQGLFVPDVLRKSEIG